jgi:hypothetical protein
MESWAAVSIAVFGTLGGTALGFLGARRISKEERDETRRAQLRTAFGEYLAAVCATVGEFRGMPADPDPGMVESLLGRLQSESAEWMRGRRAIASLGPSFSQIRLDLVAAMAHLDVLTLPSEVRTIVDETNDYLERLVTERSEQLKGEWPQIHKRLQSAAALLSGTERDPNPDKGQTEPR